jgi:hypothetical protein
MLLPGRRTACQLCSRFLGRRLTHSPLDFFAGGNSSPWSWKRHYHQHSARPRYATELTMAAVENGTPRLDPASIPPCLPHPFSSASSGRTMAKSPLTLAYSANDPRSSNLPPCTNAATLVPSLRWGYFGEVLATVPDKSHPRSDPSGLQDCQLIFPSS